MQQATRELRRRPEQLPAGVRLADMQPGAKPGTAPRVLRQAFSVGDVCDSHDGPTWLASMVEQTPLRRSAELLLGCSPLADDGEAYLVMREPEPCHYLLALWHPLLCQLWAAGGGDEQGASTELQLDVLQLRGEGLRGGEVTDDGESERTQEELPGLKEIADAEAVARAAVAARRAPQRLAPRGNAARRERQPQDEL